MLIITLYKVPSVAKESQICHFCTDTSTTGAFMMENHFASASTFRGHILCLSASLALDPASSFLCNLHAQPKFTSTKFKNAPKWIACTRW
ncbi:uncharacterized protein PHALS_01849 [Plasmopara halstedii]|uniref:Uncharacterized protein n=1 Tax=Plasmopara halstedii TaxID=4781 RepID=A0A0P1AWL0_PLAHL|nr:uncharacterized protein PHALS_01849 [Plasmopara halstedii]CEG45562.1 hypothetical protein PHALS_01849 [Plasmopara halstedii]|eukprot:XP_024581931.1 hypothetical protein PHALS_01849 [Plasmopara halstedii]